jgi:predicted CDP-diglyceride synthetase/phosphatidate cytidylyltransferase
VGGIIIFACPHLPALTIPVVLLLFLPVLTALVGEKKELLTAMNHQQLLALMGTKKIGLDGSQYLFKKASASSARP